MIFQQIGDLIAQLRATSLEFKVTILMLLILAPLSVFSVILALLTVTLRVSPAEPPMAYSSDVYAPDKNPLCAGDPLQFQFASSIRSAPYTSIVARAIFRERETGEFERVVSFPLDALPMRRTRGMTAFTRTVTETRTLPPGNYEYAQNAQTFFSAPVGFTVPFRVMECAK